MTEVQLRLSDPLALSNLEVVSDAVGGGFMLQIDPGTAWALPQIVEFARLTACNRVAVGIAGGDHPPGSKCATIWPSDYADAVLRPVIECAIAAYAWAPLPANRRPDVSPFLQTLNGLVGAVPLVTTTPEGLGEWARVLSSRRCYCWMRDDAMLH